MKSIPRALAAAIAAIALPAAFAQNAPSAAAPQAQPTPPAAATPAQPSPPAATAQPQSAPLPPADASAAVNSAAAAPTEPAAPSAALQVDANAPVPQPPANLIDEPIASAFRTDNAPEAERVKPIVDALNADASLKASKIVVVPDKDVITLVGVTVSDAQRRRAVEIAGSHAADAKVASALTTQQLVVNQPAAPPAS